MRVALLNPNWTYDGSIYFGCRKPHFPTELGCARALLEAAGHEVLLVDAHLYDLSLEDARRRIAEFAPSLTAVATAPTYLFWRSPPPELRVPRRTLGRLASVAGTLVAVGPHPSTTPRAVLRKLPVDAAVIGECEEVLVQLAAHPRADWQRITSLAWRTDDEKIVVQGNPAICDMTRTPALRWKRGEILRHRHHHHRFDGTPSGPGAEVEVTRGCQYRSTFGDNDNVCDTYRKRPLARVLDEIDALVATGVEYVYFIDETFLPDRALLEALIGRPLRFGVRTRIDEWSEEMLDLLGEAGCVSLEAGIESLSARGCSFGGKRCTTDELSALLIYAKTRVPFVQANLLDGSAVEAASVEAWRTRLGSHGVWATKPAPMFLYPGSPAYQLRWGTPDDEAWERAHRDYLSRHSEFSEVQEAHPAPLEQLEADDGATA
jgi:B12-binding domain/radical SAM domain protein of rhizo-twelve system